MQNQNDVLSIYLSPSHCLSLTIQWGRDGGGGRRNVPTPKPEKLLWKSGVIFQRSILSERSQKSKKYLVNNCEKSQFSIEILMKKSQSFLENFQKSLHFCSKRATLCRLDAYFYMHNRNHSPDLNELAFFVKIQSIFSKKFQQF